jgi:hypothetical protein
MDIYKIINQLRGERDRLNGIIQALETLASREPLPSGPRRRGRKFMDDEGRKAVSARMKRYWEEKRRRTLNPKTRAAPDQESPGGGNAGSDTPAGSALAASEGA